MNVILDRLVITLLNVLILADNNVFYSKKYIFLDFVLPASGFAIRPTNAKFKIMQDILMNQLESGRLSIYGNENMLIRADQIGVA